MTTTYEAPAADAEESGGTTPGHTTRPYALLRAGFPYYATLGMRRVTTYCTDIAIGEQGRLYGLLRDDLPNGAMIRRFNWDDEDLGTISSTGSGQGQVLWPVTLIRDREETLYASDEGLHRISAFRPDGTFVGSWGTPGSEPGQINRPAGIAFDADENIYLADALNHRVQKFTKDGRFISTFGQQGDGEGEFDMPWGVTVDSEGDLYVVDWRNDRVQKFDSEGRFIFQFGQSGSQKGQFKRPAGIAVDSDGDIYVADRGNDRIQQFDARGRYVDEFLGDATLSKMARIYVLSNPKVLRLREMLDLGPQRRLRGPASVRFDDQGRMYIPDFGCHRIQIYKKEAYPLAPNEIWPEQSSPMLYTV